MASAASVIDYAIQIAQTAVNQCGTAAALALVFGTAPDAAAASGFYADLTAASEKIAMVVGGQTGPIYTRSGSDVNVAISGAMSITKAITSTLATGTAPFAVASTTVVANLNVSALLGATWAAPAAIGTGTPAAGTFTQVTDSALTATYVTYAGASGILTNDAAFFRTAGVLSIDASTDNTFTTGYGKMGLVPSGVSTLWYIGQSNNFTTTNYLAAQDNSGGGYLNAKSGQTLSFRIGGTNKAGLTTSALTIVSGVVTTFSDATAGSSGAGSVVCAGGASFALDTMVGLTAGTTRNLVINSATGNERSIQFSTAATRRWRTMAASTAESGSDAGSPYQIAAYDDSGTLIDVPVSIVRASGGNVTIARAVSVTGSVSTTSSGNMTSAGRMRSSGTATTADVTGICSWWRSGGTIGTAGDMILQTDLAAAAAAFVFRAGLTTPATIATLSPGTIAATTPGFSVVGTSLIAGAVTDGYTAGLRLTPTYSGAFTVTRHNYIDLLNPTLAASAVLTDACVFRFDAALGTHKATTASDKTGNAKSGTLIVDVAGTLFDIQLYAH